MLQEGIDTCRIIVLERNFVEQMTPVGQPATAGLPVLEVGTPTINVAVEVEFQI